MLHCMVRLLLHKNIANNEGGEKQLWVIVLPWFSFLKKNK
jgi:hypothetical protein